MTGFNPFAVVSLDAILYNLEQIRSHIPPGIGIMAVVKDSAYGNGASIIASVLENEGKVDFFVVANADEAFALRNASIRGDILVLGKASQEQLCLGAQKRITFTCNDPNDLERWTHYDIPIPIDFHVNIDTGMRRLGFTAAECSILISTLETNPHLQCKGCFTHMACADEPGTSTVDRQYEAFEKTIPILKGAGIDLRYIHASNSAALLRFPSRSCTHVRPGIVLYGCNPDPAQSFGIDLHTVVSLKGRVVSLREVAEGTPVSYGGNYVTKERTWIATIGIGYAQGVPRYLGNCGEVLIKGKRYRIAGNVTMDYIMVDAGLRPDIDLLDEAVVIGTQGDDTITPDDVARLGNTIGYEVLCNIGASVQRTWVLRDACIGAQQPSIF